MTGVAPSCKRLPGADDGVAVSMPSPSAPSHGASSAARAPSVATRRSTICRFFIALIVFVVVFQVVLVEMTLMEPNDEAPPPVASNAAPTHTGGRKERGDERPLDEPSSPTTGHPVRKTAAGGNQASRRTPYQEWFALPPGWASAATTPATTSSTVRAPRQATPTTVETAVVASEPPADSTTTTTASDASTGGADGRNVVQGALPDEEEGRGSRGAVGESRAPPNSSTDAQPPLPDNTGAERSTKMADAVLGIPTFPPWTGTLNAADLSATSLVFRERLSRTALVVLCYNRPTHLTNALKSIENATWSDHVTKFVSQDGDEVETQAVAMSFDAFRYLNHPRTLSEEYVSPSGETVPRPGTQFLAQHYKFALDMVFNHSNSRNETMSVSAADASSRGVMEGFRDASPRTTGFDYVIVLEDDMIVSKDIIPWFVSLAPLLDRDPSLWCLSSWNDNGMPHLELPAAGVFRTSFFPGLGWMLNRKTWKALSPVWPADNWDHWMRATSTAPADAFPGGTVQPMTDSQGGSQLPQVAHERRHCVSPFLSRNRNRGDEGATANKDFFEKWLKRVVSRGDGSAAGAGAGGLQGEVAEGLFLESDEVLAALTEPSYDAAMGRRLATCTVIVSAGGPAAGSDWSYRHGEEEVSRRRGDVVPAPESRPCFLLPYESATFSQLARNLDLHPTPRTHYKHVTWLRRPSFDVYLVHAALSPFARPFSWSRKPVPSLRPTIAERAGESCTTVCGRLVETVDHKDLDPTSIPMSAVADCDGSQFDFINSCAVLSEFFGAAACGAGRCTQGWGPDIPNVEVRSGVGREPNCLITEEASRCDASHPATKRLCPCVFPNGATASAKEGEARGRGRRRPGEEGAALRGGAASAPKSTQPLLIAAQNSGLSCDEVCEQAAGAGTAHGEASMVCDPTLGHVANDCALLKKLFSCQQCSVNSGGDLPNFVTAQEDGNHGRCLIFQPHEAEERFTCDGRHPHTRRLCPCVAKG